MAHKQDFYVATSAQHMDDFDSRFDGDFDDGIEQAPHRSGKPPLTANPAFAWIVALWFAALLGIGSLILPPPLLERASVASGLPAFLPAAAPPLGFTARLLLAICGTLGGGALGFVLARRFAAPRSEASALAITGARAPLDAETELQADSIDSHDDLPQPKGRRRALAMGEEEGHSDFLNVVPLPGAADLQVGDDNEDRAWADELPVDLPQQAVAEEPFELDADAALPEGMEEAPARQEFALPSANPQPSIGISFDEPVQAAATARKPLPFSPPSMTRGAAAAPATDLISPAEEDGGQQNTPPFAPEGEPDPVASDAEPALGPESENSVSDKPYFEADAPSEAAFFDEPAPADTGSDGHDEIEADAPGEEGLVQLVQRLGSTLEKHREWAARQAAERQAQQAAEPNAPVNEPTAGEAHEVASPAPAPFDPAAAEEAAQAMAAYFGKPESQHLAAQAPEAKEDEPATVAETPPADDAPNQRYASFVGTLAAAGSQVSHDLSEDDDDEDEVAEIAASFTLPLKQEEPAPIPRPAFDQPPAAEEPEPEAAPAAIPGPFEAAAPIEGEAESDTDPRAAPRNPFKSEPSPYVRIEEPEDEDASPQPAVLFPNQSNRGTAQPPARAFDPPGAASDNEGPAHAARPAPSNDDNERALREALMNLQRMGR